MVVICLFNMSIGLKSHEIVIWFSSCKKFLPVGSYHKLQYYGFQVGFCWLGGARVGLECWSWWWGGAREKKRLEKMVK